MPLVSVSPPSFGEGLGVGLYLHDITLNKKLPSRAVLCFLWRKLRRCLARLARTAKTAHEGRETDEYIDDSLEPHPLTEKHMHHVPVLATHEPAQTYKTPVQTTDDEEPMTEH